MKRRPTAARSVLLAGPRFSRQTGGLERALADVVLGLRELGLDVDDATGASRVPEADASTRAPARTALAALNRHPWLLRHWSRLDATRRRALRDVFLRRSTIARDAKLLRELEAKLASRRYDVVLYCVEEAPRGGLALALSVHPCVIPIAIEGLAAELATPTMVERLLRWRGASKHPWFGIHADARAIRSAIMSSRTLADATVAAGLARDAAHAVYFGVPVPPVIRPDRAYEGRLLYVGRLVKDKGLHVLLDGVANARARDPRTRLTIVAGDGPPAYRALLEARIGELGLAGAVEWRTPMPRAQLASLYATHDALVFWSIFAEPAPLVAMEAMAARLPVIVPQPARESPIYERDVTCVTYDRHDSSTLADAVIALASDDARYRRIADAGATRIRESFTPIATARAYATIIEASASKQKAGTAAGPLVAA